MNREEIAELIIKAGGNAIGPLKVAAALLATDLTTGRLALEAAIEHDITGDELWLLFNDVHNRNLVATREALLLKEALGQLRQLRYSKHYLVD